MTPIPNHTYRYINSNCLNYNYHNMNVVVVDFIDLSIYNLIHSSKDINISAICVPFEKERARLRECDDSLKIYTWNDVVNWTDGFVSTTDIIANQSTQLKVERCYSRYSTQTGPAMVFYYHSLEFWKTILHDDVDVLLVADQEHGIPVDSIPLAIAKSKGIQAYTFEPIFCPSTNLGLYALHNYNSGKYVQISKSQNSSNIINLEEVLFNKKETKAVKKSELGQFINIFVSALKKKYGTNGKENYFGIPRNLKISKCLSNLIHTLVITAYYNKHSAKQISPSENYILYALHFEPEATIMNRTVYNNQIHNIEMLAKTLPKGWKIYVKEHPNQLNLKFLIKNKYIGDNIKQYRNKLYYERILSIPNVELVDYKIPSSKLMQETHNNNENGLRAISTINGTISIEAIHQNIPVILFDTASMPYEDIEDIHPIKSYDDVVTIMNVLQERDWQPRYDNYSNKIGKYLIKYSKGHGFELDDESIMKIINTDMSKKEGDRT